MYPSQNLVIHTLKLQVSSCALDEFRAHATVWTALLKLVRKVLWEEKGGVEGSDIE